MYARDFRKERVTLENRLKGGALDFTAAYLAVGELHFHINNDPWTLRRETIGALESVLANSGYSSQVQAFFLYREAARALVSIIIHADQKRLAGPAFKILQDLLRITEGPSHRASSEALGSLPISVHGPSTGPTATGDIPSARWADVLKEAGAGIGSAPTLLGRSLITAVESGKALLVVKLASGTDAFRALHGEAAWMEHLRSERFSFPQTFNVPRPITVKGSYVFKLEDLPIEIPGRKDLDSECFAMGFLASRDYFIYPNDHRPERRLSLEDFEEVMFRNAWLFGRLASQGIVHSAPIPLFHNRVQRNRRGDGGLYEWHRGGRLDRWLRSCAYPNFGLAGIRDFEHFASFNGSGRELYFHIGTQIFSLLLTTGSYFRNKDITRVGLNRHGEPVDARDLFDKSSFQELIRGVFLNYYEGFAEGPFNTDPPFRFDVLTSRMIEEMGVDRHMEEILRVADQEEMSDGSFRGFLRNRGYTEEEIGTLKREEKDIVVHTGPHLGGFNQRISLPELIDSVGAMSALCIAGKYWKEKGADVHDPCLRSG